MTETEVIIRKCGRCGHEGEVKVIPRTGGVHRADLRCVACNHHLGFPPKLADDPTKYKRPNTHRDLALKYGNGFCEMCLVAEKDFPKGWTLEGHHVDPYKDGGSEKRENIWVVCTRCHRLIEWVRKYMPANMAPTLINQVTDATVTAPQDDEHAPF